MTNPEAEEFYRNRRRTQWVKRGFIAFNAAVMLGFLGFLGKIFYDGYQWTQTEAFCVAGEDAEKLDYAPFTLHAEGRIFEMPGGTITRYECGDGSVEWNMGSEWREPR